MKFLTWLVSLIQLIVAMFIIIVHVLLIKGLEKSQQQIEGITSKKQSIWKIAVQILLITPSNVICWVPSGIIFLTSTFLDKYPIEIIFWTKVSVTTLNSLINPIIFAWSTVKKISNSKVNEKTIKTDRGISAI